MVFANLLWSVQQVFSLGPSLLPFWKDNRALWLAVGTHSLLQPTWLDMLIGDPELSVEWIELRRAPIWWLQMLLKECECQNLMWTPSTWLNAHFTAREYSKQSQGISVLILHPQSELHHRKVIKSTHSVTGRYELPISNGPHELYSHLTLKLLKAQRFLAMILLSHISIVPKSSHSRSMCDEKLCCTSLLNVPLISDSLTGLYFAGSPILAKPRPLEDAPAYLHRTSESKAWI